MKNKFALWPIVLQILPAIWLIISPWILGFTGNDNAMMNCIIMGILVGTVAVIHYINAKKS